MAGWWLAGYQGGGGLAQRGGEAGEGACAAGTPGLAFEPDHGRTADPGLARELGCGQAVLAA
jgi:hypothetical protein